SRPDGGCGGRQLRNGNIRARRKPEGPAGGGEPLAHVTRGARRGEEHEPRGQPREDHRYLRHEGGGGTTRREELRVQIQAAAPAQDLARSEEHTSELQSPYELVCRLLLEKKKRSQKRQDCWLRKRGE